MKDCSEPKLNGKLGRSEAQQKTMGPWMTMVSIQFHPLVASWKMHFVDSTELDVAIPQS